MKISLLRPCLAAVATAAILISSSPAYGYGPMNRLNPSGPGGRIFGLDISRYQHGTSAPIDFAKMARSGVSFLWINGGNSIAKADAQAAKFYLADRVAAQGQGIYTGLYYFVHLPNTTSASIIKRNADDQANKIITRINTQGGLNYLDLPVALDIETTCTRTSLFGICRHHFSPAQTALWVNEWQKVILAATHRNPVIYSFLSLLHGSLGTNHSLVLDPLWVSTAGISAAKPNSQPAQRKGGCSSNIWTDESCTMQWSFWQYSSGGNGRTYGIPSGQVDLDVFAGSAQDFINLAQSGTGVPLGTPVITAVETNTATAAH